MLTIMSTLTAARRRRASSSALTLDRFAAGVGPHSIETLRGFFLALIGDLGAPSRHDLEDRIERARRIDDFWHLRSAMFSAISLDRGEQVARERLAAFDARWQ